MADAYEHSLNRVREAAGPDAEESAAIEVLAVRATRQEDLVEKFKMRNALLGNSLVYFGTFSARLAASDDRPVVAAASALAAAILPLTLDTSPVAVPDVKDRLVQLAALQTPPRDAQPVQAAPADARSLPDLLPL